jgi:hypothetical protein
LGRRTILLSSVPFGQSKKAEKELKITIPETNLELRTAIFDDLFEKYTENRGAEARGSGTTNMGTCTSLPTAIVLKQPCPSKKNSSTAARCTQRQLSILSRLRARVQ